MSGELTDYAIITLSTLEDLAGVLSSHRGRHPALTVKRAALTASGVVEAKLALDSLAHDSGRHALRETGGDVPSAIRKVLWSFNEYMRKAPDDGKG